MASADEPVQAVGVSAGAADSKPLVATLARWAAGSVGFALGLAAAAEGSLLFAHSSRSFETVVTPLALASGAAAVVLAFILRAEESRLARELRTARTGTAALRALVARRRVAQPFLARFASTPLGTAAVLVADGDRDGAVELMAKTPALMRRGRLDRLRAIVEADVSRGDGAGGLARSLNELRAMPPFDNRDAELYRLHVLVKTVLALGNGEAAFELATQLGDSSDDEARVYATWLRVWFDLDVDDHGDASADASASAHTETSEGAGGWPPIAEGDLRVATLIARAHGADDLVTKLTERLSAIAQPGPGE
jgi:hypothetical protein